jgi:hypothetical protein
MTYMITFLVCFGFLVSLSILYRLYDISNKLKVQNELSSKKLAVLLAHTTLSAKERGMDESKFMALINEISTED